MDTNTRKPDKNNTSSCDCPVETLTLHFENATYDEHQHSIPATCQQCGKSWEYIYTEAGVRNPETFEYNHEF